MGGRRHQPHHDQAARRLEREGCDDDARKNESTSESECLWLARFFTADEFQELAKSIEENGWIVPDTGTGDSEDEAEETRKEFGNRVLDRGSEETRKEFGLRILDELKEAKAAGPTQCSTGFVVEVAAGKRAYWHASPPGIDQFASVLIQNFPRWFA